MSHPTLPRARRGGRRKGVSRLRSALLGVLAVAILASACIRAEPAGGWRRAAGLEVRVAPVSRAGFGVEELARIHAAEPHVARASQRWEADPSLVRGLIWVESRFERRARSSAGARGLMQLMPATARDLGHKLGRRVRPYDPSFNVDAGTYYLSRMLTRYDGHEALALAAYHAGPGNADRYREAGTLPPSIRSYVHAVLQARERFRALARGDAPLPTTRSRGERLALAIPASLPPTGPSAGLTFSPEPPAARSGSDASAADVATPADEPAAPAPETEAAMELTPTPDGPVDPDLAEAAPLGRGLLPGVLDF